MNKLMKILKIGLMMLSIVGTLSAENIKYKNVIIFGDSLSDTGNMPKSGSVSSGVEPPMNYILPVTNPISFSFMGKEIALPKYAGNLLSGQYHRNYTQKNIIKKMISILLIG